ncbi:MAG: c-type cytochrome [Deltaproteobacteria bacterium]|nr:c-type cytochrome [Deltaproteobacteria bacterium]
MIARWLAPVLLVLGGCGGSAEVTPAARQRAATIWSERCANCHGPTGRGDGPGAKLLPRAPRNFADATWQGSVDDARIAQVIVDGGLRYGLDSNMAANPDLQREPAVVSALVELIRGL